MCCSFVGCELNAERIYLLSPKRNRPTPEAATALRQSLAEVRAAAHAALEPWQYRNIPIHKATECAHARTERENYKRVSSDWLRAKELQLPIDMRKKSLLKPFKFTCKMAAQVDLLRVKVEEKSRDSFDKATKEKKKKKKRECSPSDDTREKEAKKIKLHNHQHHHQQHAQQRAHPPHQQQNSQARNFSKEQAPVQHRHHHHHHHHSSKKELPPGWPPRKVTPAAHVPQKTVLPPSPLFTFTPLKVAKAETPNNKPKHIEKDVKLKPKKENAEANVKVPECKKKKGNFNSV